MQAIRQIIETQKLKSLIDIPDDFSSEKVEIIIFPILSEQKTETPFNPEQFFGSSQDAWPEDFFTQTAGCLADAPLERAPQGDYEQRQEWP